MGEALTIGVRRERGCAIVAVAGEIDIATVTRLREWLFELAATGRPLIADLDQASFIDSTGLGALADAAKRARGGMAAACARSASRPKILQLSRLTGLDRRIPLARTLDQALQALAAAGPHPASRPQGDPDRRPGSRGERTQAMRPGQEAPPPGPQDLSPRSGPLGPAGS